jgi:hypothetical protein
MRRFLTALVVAALLGACGSDDSSDSAVTTLESDSNMAPFHAVPGDAQVVWGTVSCADRGGLALECELDMSDPRVSGTETIEGFQMVAPGSVGRVWIFDSDVITNADGTWRGSAQGADDPPGNPTGESHLVGEGGYEGLEFHYYFTEPVLLEGGFLRGWISESTPADPASSTAPVAPFHPVPAGSVAVSGTAACDDTGSVRMADDARIATAEGTWRGRIQAATDDAAVPAAVGEAHYIGEGAHEGLEFHYYFADLDIAEDGPVRVHGWISPAT